jgi:hypothetical protein
MLIAITKLSKVRIIFWGINYEKSVPFLLMLPKSLTFEEMKMGAASTQSATFLTAISRRNVV